MFHRGITLLELLLVLVLVSVIASLALPAYRQQMIRVHRTEAMIALLELQAAEEKFYLRHNTYTRDIAAASTRPGSRYALSIAVATDGQSFVATATPTSEGGQSADLDCLAYSIDAQGRRAVSGSRDARYCWK